MTTIAALAPEPRLYRCVYCQHIVGALARLLEHEPQSPDRKPMVRHWTRARAKAKRREELTGHV